MSSCKLVTWGWERWPFAARGGQAFAFSWGWEIKLLLGRWGRAEVGGYAERKRRSFAMGGEGRRLQ